VLGLPVLTRSVDQDAAGILVAKWSILFN